MIDDLIRLYKEELSFASFIYPKWGRAIIMLLVLLIPIFILWFFLVDFKEILNGVRPIYLSPALYSFSAALIVLFTLAEIFARNKINTSFFNIAKRNEFFKIHVRLRFNEYISEETQLIKVPTEKVLTLLEKRSLTEKLAFTSYRIAFGVLGGTVWVSFVNSIFSLSEVGTLEATLIVFLALISITFFIALIYVFLKRFIEDIMTDYLVIKRLVELFEENELLLIIREANSSK